MNDGDEMSVFAMDEKLFEGDCAEEGSASHNGLEMRE